MSRLDFCTTIILLRWQLYKFMPFFPVISLFTFPHIFPRPTSFLQKSSCSVSSDKNILNSSVEWSRVEWSDVRKTQSLLSQTCFVYYQYGHTRRMIMYARALYRSFKVKWKSLPSHTCFVYYHCAHDNVRTCVIQ